MKNAYFIIVLTSLLMSIGFASATSFDWGSAGIISYYPFEEGTGNNSEDITTNQYNLTCINCEGDEWSDEGIIGKAMSFDYTSDNTEYFTHSSTEEFNNTQSISLWFYNEDMSGSVGSKILIGKSNDELYGGLSYNDGDQKIKYYPSNGTSSPVVISDALNRNEWYFITLVMEGNNRSLYVNGAYVMSGNDSISNPFENVYNLSIGGSKSPNTRTIRGKIDELALYNTSITPNEILELYNNNDGIQYNYPFIKTYYPSTGFFGDTLTWGITANLSSGESLTGANFIFNSTLYTTTINSLGGDSYNITSTISIPFITGDIPFEFNISTSLNNYSSYPSTINISSLSFDNCTTNSYLAFNISLYDERILSLITGNIEYTLTLFTGSSQEISSFNGIINNTSSTNLCSNIGLNETTYLYDLELRYYSSPDGGVTYNYVPEFYNIQKAEGINLPQTLNLYDLNVNESTEFTIFYRDNNYNPRPNTLLIIQRRYLSEGIFRTVEIPITSNEGQAIGHFDTNNYQYKIIASQNGVVLNTFENPTIACESELTGICEILLNGQASPPQAQNTQTNQNFEYTASQDNQTISVSYVIPNGETATITITMTQVSAFADPTIICSQSLLSSSGSLDCSVDPTIGDSQVIIRISKDGELIAQLTAVYEEDLGSVFALNNYFIASLMMIVLVTMVVTSPPLMIISSLFGVLYLGVVFLIKGSSILMITGIMSWLLLAGIIVLLKLNKKDEA